MMRRPRRRRGLFLWESTCGRKKDLRELAEQMVSQDLRPITASRGPCGSWAGVTWRSVSALSAEARLTREVLVAQEIALSDDPQFSLIFTNSPWKRGTGSRKPGRATATMAAE